MIEPEEGATADSFDGSSASSSRCNLNEVVLRNPHQKTTATSPNPPTSCSDVSVFGA